MANDFVQMIFDQHPGWFRSTGPKGWSGFSPRSTMTISDTGKFHCYDSVAGPPRASFYEGIHDDDSRLRYLSGPSVFLTFLLVTDDFAIFARGCGSIDRATSNGPPTQHGLFSMSLSPHV